MFVCSDTDHCSKRRAAGLGMQRGAAMTLAEDQPLLVAEGLGKLYGGRVGCLDVSFELWAGRGAGDRRQIGLGQIDAAQMPVDAAGAHRADGFTIGCATGGWWRSIG